MIQVLSTNDRHSARCLFEIDRRRHHASTLVLSWSDINSTVLCCHRWTRLGERNAAHAVDELVGETAATASSAVDVVIVLAFPRRTRARHTRRRRHTCTFGAHCGGCEFTATECSFALNTLFEVGVEVEGFTVFTPDKVALFDVVGHGADAAGWYCSPEGWAKRWSKSWWSVGF